jgi:hypothetical protein
MLAVSGSRCFSQVLVMTHELSKPEMFSDYLAKVLSPAPVLLVLGRSKDAFPPCKSDECMWYAWKDCRVKLYLCHLGVFPLIFI